MRRHKTWKALTRTNQNQGGAFFVKPFAFFDYEFHSRESKTVMYFWKRRRWWDVFHLTSWLEEQERFCSFLCRGLSLSWFWPFGGDHSQPGFVSLAPYSMQSASNFFGKKILSRNPLNVSDLSIIPFLSKITLQPTHFKLFLRMKPILFGPSA